MNRRTDLFRPALTGLLAAVLGLGAAHLGAPAVADDVTTVKIGTVAPDRTPWASMLKAYRKQVQKLSSDQIKVRVYLGGIKGDEQSLVRQVYKGDTLQVCGVSTAAVSTIVTDIEILELPFLFDDADQADRILDGPARPIIERMLEEKGFKLLMYSENGYRSFGTKGGFVKTPADLKAKKMRSQESTVHVETYRALGASPVTISVGEVMSALQTGVVEGFDNTPLFATAASWYQAIDHFTVSRHIYQPAMTLANKKWFDALPADQQEALMKPTKVLQDKGREAIRAMDPVLIENFTKNGIEVYHLTDEERGAFRDATRSVWDKRRESASEDGKKLLDAILEAKAADR